MPAAKRPRTPKASAVDLYADGARVLSVFGAFGSHVLVEMPTELALKVFPDGLSGAARSDVVEAVERDLADLAKRASGLAKSALAASALTMAYEMQDPYNSATSKSMCAKVLVDTIDGLRTLAPADEEKDGLDDLAAQRKKRIAERARRSAAADSPRS